MGFVTVFVLERLLANTDGKDKIMKVMQYLAKVLVMARDRGVILSVDPKADLWPSLTAFITNVSTARKVIRLGHGISSVSEILTFFSTNDPKTPSAFTRLLSPKTSFPNRKQLLLAFITPALSLVNDSIDDLICLAKITNSSDKARINRLTRLSDRVWFASIILDLKDAWEKADILRRRVADQQFCVNGAIEHLEPPLASPLSFHTPTALSPHLPLPFDSNAGQKTTVTDIKQLQTQLSQTRDKLFMQNLTGVKLVIDFVFCAYDVFELESHGVSGDVQVVSGFVAGVVGLYKIYRKFE